MIAGVHRVAARLADGQRVVYHYAGRGGPRFWVWPRDGAEGSEKYVEALQEKRARAGPKIGRAGSFTQLVTAYMASAEFLKLRDRTRSDYRVWARRLADEFGEHPAALLEDPRFKRDLLEWRDRWAETPRLADYAWSVTRIIANWAQQRGVIGQHVVGGVGSLYRVDRSEIIWEAPEIEKFRAGAPQWVERILTAALNTALRIGDLCGLSREHVQPQAIRIRTGKRGRVAWIPILPEMRRLLDQTPPERDLILTSERGKPLTPHRASEGVKQWRRKTGVDPRLRLHDARGTAATRLLQAGVDLDSLSAIMGWSLRYAQNVIDAYAAASPGDAAAIVAKMVARHGEN